jgi:anti-sigma factor RsiW
MTSRGRAELSNEELYSYFDDEVDDAARAKIEKQIEKDAERQAELEELRLIRGAVTASLEAEADKVPVERFEQIWDEIDQALNRESRLQEAAERGASIWARLGGWLRPVRLPLALAGAAAVVAVFWLRGRDPGVNNQQGIASVIEDAKTPAPAEEPGSDTQTMPPKETQIAEALAPTEVDAEPFPAPESNEAEIRRIEFGGKSGRISTIEGARGTTTVIWISEEEPIDSERPL